MNGPVQLDDWAVVYATDDLFQAPEQALRTLKGRVTGHPIKADGSVVQTNTIASAVGRLVTTESGTVYRLGDPSPNYRQWLLEHRPNWDAENPITILV